MTLSNKKILTKSQAKNQLNSWKLNGEKVVFTNGCFDIIHLGHVDYLEKARALGNRLVVGLNSDASVSGLKGPDRPIVPELDRARVLSALESVDMVIFFHDPTPIELIKLVAPDVLVKGGDYTLETIVGADFVLDQGGEVETIPFIEGRSTSSLIEKIQGLKR